VLFKDYATAWRETYQKSLRNKASRAKLLRIVETICKPLHKMRMDHIGTDQIITLVLDPIRLKVETARDTRQRLKLIMDAAIADNLRKDNPADYQSRLRPKLGRAPKRSRLRGPHKGLAYQDLPAFMAKLAALPDLGARALEITILNVARTVEIRKMRYAHLDLDKGVWDLKAAGIITADSEGGEGTKNDVDKKTPLSRQSVAILRKLAESRVGDLVFPGRDLAAPMSDATMLKRIKQLTGDPKMTVHGVRGTFRTWAQEETDFEEEIVEHCMYLITGDAAEKTYKHGQALKKRRVVLQAFADFALPPARKMQLVA
jgi:integrase